MLPSNLSKHHFIEPRAPSSFSGSSNQTTKFQLKRLTKMLSRNVLNQTFVQPTTTTNLSRAYSAYSKTSSYGKQALNWTRTSVTLKAQDLTETLDYTFVELYLNREMADVSLICEGNLFVFKAHRFVLSRRSMYFREALKVEACLNPVIALKNVYVYVLGEVLDFMYLKQVNLKSESALQQFLSVAKYLMGFSMINTQKQIKKIKVVILSTQLKIVL